MKTASSLRHLHFQPHTLSCSDSPRCWRPRRRLRVSHAAWRVSCTDALCPLPLARPLITRLCGHPRRRRRVSQFLKTRPRVPSRHRRRRTPARGVSVSLQFPLPRPCAGVPCRPPPARGAAAGCSLLRPSAGARESSSLKCDCWIGGVCVCLSCVLGCLLILYTLGGRRACFPHHVKTTSFCSSSSISECGLSEDERVFTCSRAVCVNFL